MVKVSLPQSSASILTIIIFLLAGSASTNGDHRRSCQVPSFNHVYLNYGNETQPKETGTECYASQTRALGLGISFPPTHNYLKKALNLLLQPKPHHLNSQHVSLFAKSGTVLREVTFPTAATLVLRAHLWNHMDHLHFFSIRWCNIQYEKVQFHYMQSATDLILILYYFYIVLLIRDVCLYIRGYNFQYLIPVSERCEDQLSCVQANVTAWTNSGGNFPGAPVFKTQEDLENAIDDQYIRFASFISDPGSWPGDLGCIYRRCSNIGLLMMILGLYGCCAFLARIWAQSYLSENAAFASARELGLISIPFCGICWLKWRQVWGGGAASLGRAMRLSGLAREIRKRCLGGLIEDVEGAGLEPVVEEFTWWFRNLLNESSPRAKKGKEDHDLDKRIEWLIEDIRV